MSISKEELEYILSDFKKEVIEEVKSDLIEALRVEIEEDNLPPYGDNIMKVTLYLGDEAIDDHYTYL